MIGIGIANSLGVNLSGLSPATKSFVTATGISDPTKVKAINDLVVGLQSSGLWSKMKAVYPFVTDNRNLLGYTEDFGNAAWTSNEVTITSNSTTAPNGTLTAETLTASTTNAAHYIFQSINTNSGSTVTFSCFVKNNGGNYIQFLAGGIFFTISNPYQNFDLINGTLAQGNIPNSTIENVGNGWYRISITIEAASSGSAGYFLCPILNGTTGRLDAFTGNGTSGVYIWGAQLELGSTATTYQPIATTQQAFISNQFKYNLKDPRDTDAAFRLVFNGGWSFSSTGATPNGVNGYADTKLIPSSVLQLNSASHSVYSRSLSPVAIMGGVNDASNYMILNNPTLTTITSQINSIGNDFITGTITNSQGLLMANRTSSTIINAWRNSTKVATDIKNTTARPTKNYYIGARNSDGIAANFDGKQYAFYHIGDGLTDDDATNLYYYIQVFQTTLGRQVGSPAYALPTTYDASAKLYLSAIGSTTDSTLNNAVDTFIKGLKADGIYSKMKAVYPFATDNRNLLSYTNAFGNSYYITDGTSSFTPNNTTAPDGTNTATRFIAIASNNNYFYSANTAQGQSFGTGNKTLSIYVKAGTFSGNVALSITSDGNTQSTVATLTNDWQRITVTKNVIVAGGTPQYYIDLGTTSMTSGQFFYIWGAQLENGTSATTYQPILTTQQAYISSQFKYNMVNPQDDDSAFRLVFNGGWTHSANGATPNGVNAYADTKLNILNILSLTNSHHSAYLRTNYAISTSGAFGAESGTTTRMTFFPYTFNIGWGSDIYDNSQSRISSNTGNSTGYVIGSRASTSSHKLFRNGTEIASTTNNTNGSRPNLNYWIGGYNVSNALQFSIASQLSLYSIGDGLTDTEAANLYTRVQAFQTALSRQV